MQSNERSKHLSYFFSKADDGVERQKSKAKMRAITYLRKCGVCWGGGTFRGREGGGLMERKYRSPLYYPDTLVNPDTCLGNLTA